MAIWCPSAILAVSDGQPLAVRNIIRTGYVGQLMFTYLCWASDRSGGSIATENIEDTETGEKNKRTEEIVGAAIEVHRNFGCPRLADGIKHISL